MMTETDKTTFLVLKKTRDILSNHGIKSDVYDDTINKILDEAEK